MVGFAVWVLFAPLMFAIALVLAISIVGIPLLLLLPFAVLALLLMALVGFSGTAFAIGQWTRRHAGIGAVPAAVDVCLGILVIMMPLLLGRVWRWRDGRSVRSCSCWWPSGWRWSSSRGPAGWAR